MLDHSRLTTIAPVSLHGRKKGNHLGAIHKVRLDDLKRERDNTEDCEAESSLLFRGQENSNWWLSTALNASNNGLHWKDYYAVISKIKPQIESLTNNQWAIAGVSRGRTLGKGL